MPEPHDVRTAFSEWMDGGTFPPHGNSSEGEWVYNDRLSFTSDLISMASVGDVLSNRSDALIVAAKTAKARTGAANRFMTFLLGSGRRAWPGYDPEFEKRPGLGRFDRIPPSVPALIVFPNSGLVKMISGRPAFRWPAPAVA